ncbi:MAG: class I SAM-dependent methyltransferase [Candidatus Eisenbacteria bacterium]
MAQSNRGGAQVARRKRNAVPRDKHVLYERAVQCPEADVRFFDRIYKKANGKPASLLREDFCGTAALAAEWVRSRPDNRAIGVDLHRPTLAWGRKHNIAPLGAAAARVELLEQNVLDVTRPKVDMVAALNFSYFIFKQRNQLKEYFQTVKKSLRPGGMFVLDIFGGTECQDLDTETKHLDGFKYHWDQVSYNPVDSETLYHIHFSFPDGTWMRKAFTYDWRMWTPREVTELLEEVGFADATVYWEGADEDGDGNGVFRPAKRRTPERGWIAYISGVRS